MSSPVSGDGAPNAKQIVFLFMAATVVAVVVFLCGVLVGRGVPLPGRGTTTAAAGSGHEDVPPATLGQPRSEPSAAAAESEDLSYPGILTEDAQSPLTIAGSGSDAPVAGSSTEPSEVESGPDEADDPPRSDHPAPMSAPDQRVVPDAVAEAANGGSDPDTDTVTGSAPPGGGYWVQVVALRQRHSVSGVLERLLEKELPATVLDPDADAPIALYKVRVGPYASRAEADRVRERLETEDEFAPFVIR